MSAGSPVSPRSGTRIELRLTLAACDARPALDVVAELDDDARNVSLLDLTDRGKDLSDAGTGAPHNLASIIAAVELRGRKSGRIDARVIVTTGPDGRPHKSYIVDVPGTKVLNTPGSRTNEIQDMGTNFHAIANHTTA